MKSPFRSIKHKLTLAFMINCLKIINKDITFVKIGVLDGGSLCGENSLGRKLDYRYRDKRIFKVWREHGFEIFIGSQGDPSFWKNFMMRLVM